MAKAKPKAQPEGEKPVGNKSPPRIHQFGGKEANPQGRGPERGVRYFKPALKRYMKAHPKAMELIVKGLVEDAKGLTTVKDGERISPADKQRAATLIRDSLDGKPVQEIDIAGAPTTMVIVAHATGDLDPELSTEIAEIVHSHEEEAAEPVDLSNPHPTEEPDEPAD